MKLTFLGTAAAEGVPAVFCNCPTCVAAKRNGGKDIRTRSQILINADTLFDFPMDTYMHMLKYKLDLSAVKRVLITHSHMDHCYPQEFCMRGGPFAHGMTENIVKVYGNPSVVEMFENDTAREMRDEVKSGISVITLHPFDDVTDEDMRIIAVPAVHTANEECLVYYAEQGGVGVLLMNDTGIVDRSVFAKLSDMNVNVRIAVLDCTYGAKRHGAGRHMGLYDITDQRELMESVGLTGRNTVFYATHFSHNGVESFSEMSALAEREGISVAYDGCVAEVK